MLPETPTPLTSTAATADKENMPASLPQPQKQMRPLHKGKNTSILDYFKPISSSASSFALKDRSKQGPIVSVENRTVPDVRATATPTVEQPFQKQCVESEPQIVIVSPHSSKQEFVQYLKQPVKVGFTEPRERIRQETVKKAENNVIQLDGDDADFLGAAKMVSSTVPVASEAPQIPETIAPAIPVATTALDKPARKKKKLPVDDLDATHMYSLPAVKWLPKFCAKGMDLPMAKFLDLFQAHQFISHYHAVFDIDTFDLDLVSFMECFVSGTAFDPRLNLAVKGFLYHLLSEKLPSNYIDSHASTTQCLWSFFLDALDADLFTKFQTLEFEQITFEERLRAIQLLISALMDVAVFTDHMDSLVRQYTDCLAEKVEKKKERNIVLIDITTSEQSLRNTEQELVVAKAELDSFLVELEKQFAESEAFSDDDKRESSRLANLVYKRKQEAFMAVYQVEIDTKQARYESLVETKDELLAKLVRLKNQKSVFEQELDNGGLDKKATEIVRWTRNLDCIMLGQDRYFRRFWFMRSIGGVFVEPIAETIACRKTETYADKWQYLSSFAELEKFSNNLSYNTPREKELRKCIAEYSSEIKESFAILETWLYKIAVKEVASTLGAEASAAAGQQGVEAHMAVDREFEQAVETEEEANKENMVIPEHVPSITNNDYVAIFEDALESMKLVAQYRLNHAELEDLVNESIIKVIETSKEAMQLADKTQCCEVISGWFEHFTELFMQPHLNTSCLYCDLVLLKDVETDEEIVEPFRAYWDRVLVDKNMPFIAMYVSHWDMHLRKFLKQMGSRFGALKEKPQKAKVVPKKRVRVPSVQEESLPMLSGKRGTRSAKRVVDYRRDTRRPSARNDEIDEDDKESSHDEAIIPRTRSKRTSRQHQSYQEVESTEESGEEAVDAVSLRPRRRVLSDDDDDEAPPQLNERPKRPCRY